MYGGVYSDTIFNDLWYFNLFTDMWTPLVYNTKPPFVNPPPLKEFSMIISKSGILLYGGETWVSTDLSVVDAD